MVHNQRTKSLQSMGADYESVGNEGGWGGGKMKTGFMNYFSNTMLNICTNYFKYIFMKEFGHFR